MELQDVIRHRRMVRRFTDEPVAQANLDRILANAVRGPSAGFSQGQAFLVPTGADLPDFWRVTGEAVSETAQTAPLIIVPMSCKRAGRTGTRPGGRCRSGTSTPDSGVANKAPLVAPLAARCTEALLRAGAPAIIARIGEPG